MEAHVSLDLYKGMVVRMIGGRPGDMIVYSRDSLSYGFKLLERGLRRIHVVDLEAALERGRISEYALKLAGELRASGAFVTIAGGLRTLPDLEKALDSADRAVVGTAIHRGLIRVEDALSLGGDRIVLALDERDGRVVYSGWREESGFSVSECLERYSSLGFKIFLVTDTRSDGSLSGVRVEAASRIPWEYRRLVLYAGGVRSLEDLRLLARLGFKGVVVGRAYYEGLLKPEDIMEAERL